MTTFEQQGSAVVIRSSEGARLQGGPSTLTLKVQEEQSLGFSMGIFEAAAGFQAPPELHGHTHEDWAAYVLEGEVTFATADGDIHASVGDVVLFKRGTRFAWSNQGQGPASYLAVWCPAGFERFFCDLGDAVRDQPEVIGNPEAMGRIVRPLWERYGIN